MIAWFAKNHVAANLLLLVIVLSGTYSVSQRLPLEVFPDFATERVTVTVSQRAATPEDMELSIANRIEEAIADLPVIKTLYSTSNEQVVTVTAELQSNADVQQALNDIKSRVDAISTLPVDAERPIVEVPLHKIEVVSLAVYGDIDEKELSQIARRIRDELSHDEAITQAAVDGVRDFEIGIEVSENTLREYNLSLDDIARIIRAQAADLSAGRIRSVGGEILVRTKGQAYRYGQFADIVIKRFENGAELRLVDIAEIKDGFEEDPMVTRFNGRPAAVVDIYRVGQESAIAVSDAVKSYLQENRQRFPPTVQLALWDDDAQIIQARLGMLRGNALQGAILVFILLTMFLKPVVAFWVVVGIPVCFAGGLALMVVAGVSINVFSSFAFLLVLGVVVDDAIVTGENIYTHNRRGSHGLEAAVNGTREVAIPVIFGVLTTIVAFVPFAIMEGRMAVLLNQIAIVVISVLIFSLIESKLILPAHLKHLTVEDKDQNGLLSRWQNKLARGLENIANNHYQPLLEKALATKYLTLLGFVCASIIAIAVVTSGWTKFTFFPRIQSETARASITMQQGTSFEETQAVVKRIEQAAFALQHKYRDNITGKSIVENIFSSAGGGAGRSHRGRVRFEITPPELRSLTITSSELVAEWRNSIGLIPGLDQITYRAEIGRPGDPIDVQLIGDDIQQLSEVAQQVRNKLMSFDGVFDLTDTLADGKQELHIALKPEAELLGLTLEQVSRQVRSALFGSQAQRIQRGQDDIRVMVRYPLNDRTSVDQLDELLIRTNAGEQARFADIATLSWHRSAAAIYHVDRLRAINVQADINKEMVNMTALRRDLTEFMDSIILQYPAVQYSLEGEAAEQRDSLDSVFWGGAFVLFAIYALLAIPFASYAQPFIVMSVIPFSLLGAIIGHWLIDIDLSMMSIMGMMALVGIVVNDSLILVDWINRRIGEGQDITDAVRNAGVARFRAITLTSVTTFAGLLPILLEKSTHAQFLIPMATSLGFGVLFGTLITLILVPCHFLILKDIKDFGSSFRTVSSVPSDI